MTQTIHVYVGGYTRKGGDGIYVYQLDLQSGALDLLSSGPAVESPSYLALAPGGRFLYAVNEVGEFEGQKTGAVSAFAVDPATGALMLLNQQSSGGGGPCHLDIDRTGRYALVANYGGGSVAMLPIQADGSLAPASDFVQHQGASADPGRQKGPHAHSFNVDPANRFAFSPDLGLDRVLCYRLDLEHGSIPPADPAFAPVAAGSGPRHMAFHPNGRVAYVITEMGNTLVVFDYDAERGALSEIQTLSTLPAGWEGTSYCADVHVSADGRFVYGSNRGHDSIALCAVDPATGKLELIDTTPCGGDFPRSFGIDPTGSFLIVANQNSDNLVVYRIDRDSGRLQAAGVEVSVPIPVCVKSIAR